MNLSQELRNNLTTAAELAQVFPDIKINNRIEEILEKYPISIPQYYLSLIDKNDSNDMFKAYVNCPGLDAKGTRPSKKCK